MSESVDHSGPVGKKESAVPDDVVSSTEEFTKGMISGIAVQPLFDVASASAVLRLFFSDSERELFRAEQDLGQTLWVAAAVAESIAYALEKMVAQLNPTALENCVGERFVNNLTELEESTKKIRALIRRSLDG